MTSQKFLEIYKKTVHQKSVIKDINKELDRQDELWGQQDHSLSNWITILGEEFGEVCQEISEIRMAETLEEIANAKLRLDDELIQVIAVCFRIIEKIRFKNVNS
jgi:NTP pyrophosphatase (non-canonical NTP hydrolase)